MQFGILTVINKFREDVLITWKIFLSCSFDDVSLASRYNNEARSLNGYTDKVTAVSDPESVDRADKEMFLSQETFQAEKMGQIPEIVDFDVTTLADGVDMDNYLANDLELGQFFVPDEFERWVHFGRSR